MSLPFPRPVRRILRQARRRVWPGNLRLVYHDRYDAAFRDVPNDALRAARILAFLASEGLVLRRDVKRPEAVWMKALEAVHAADYLDSLADPQSLTSIMGSPMEPDMAERMLEYQRLQTGGTMMAVRRARRSGLGVNLGGGFHHAHAEMGGGFCLFNDVAVAIADERRRGFEGRVLVVDLDVHDGDGTRAIFRHDPTVHTFSIHGRHWEDPDLPEPAVESTAIELGSGVDDATYLAAIEEHLPPVMSRFRPRLVIYLAGCDPAHDDQLGDWLISGRALLERDLRVVDLVRQVHRSRRTGLCVLLAGGYSADCWRYSARFLSHLEIDDPPEPPSTEEITLRRYRYLASFFSAAELSGGEDSEDLFGLTSEDLALPGWSGQQETRFLGFYTRHALELVLERTGFLDRLRDLGFPHPELEMSLEGPAGDSLRIYGDPEHLHLLCELRLRRDRRTLPNMELLSVEWLMMQNPKAGFSTARPRFPGQEHPGLGLLQDVVALLILACERLHLDGLAFVPSRFHVAAYGRSYLSFVDPKVQARFAALLHFIEESGLSFPAAARAVDEKRLIDDDPESPSYGKPVPWTPAPMVMGVSPELRRLVAERTAEAAALPRPRFRLEPAG